MTRFITSIFLVSLTASAVGSGCGSGFSSRGGEAGDGDGEDFGDGDGDSSEEGAGGMGGAPDDGEEPPVEMGGQGGALVEEPPVEEPPEEPEEPVCDPDAEDLPDDEHFDANCDGIDGDIEGAVFVSSAGSLSAAGTMSDPLDSIGAAIALAQEELKDVYVCKGEYDEQVFMEAEGVDLFGGFDCDDGWARTEELSVVAPASGSAVHLKSVYDVHVEGFEFRAADATSRQFSVIAAIVQGAQDIEFKSVVVVAGDARPGAEGEDGRPFPDGQRGRAGTPGSSYVDDGSCDGCNGLGGTSRIERLCPDGKYQEVGGDGGDGADSDNSPSYQSGFPSPDSNNSGGMATGDPGTEGSSGSNGQDAAVSSRAVGNLNGTEYVVSNSGASGDFGENGEAGGGGAGGRRYDLTSVYQAGGGGGQGGYGACGGPPGTGGGGGGASIGLAVVSSSVSFSNVTVRAGDGGRGGNAGAGAAGQLASVPGTGGIRAGAGGAGGRGGRGGHGSPGGGGPSLGIALRGGQLGDTSSLTIELGAPGGGGTPVGNRPGASDGLAAEAYDFDTDEEVIL